MQTLTPEQQRCAIAMRKRLDAVDAARRAKLPLAAPIRSGKLFKPAQPGAKHTCGPHPSWTGAQMIRFVSDRNGISVDEIKGEKRFRLIAWARQEAMWLLVRVRGLTYPQAAAMLGGRDHTTVIHGVQAHQKRIDDGERS